jgi:outer membrane protein OmpA-like peptidoglycan-associated protein
MKTKISIFIIFVMAMVAGQSVFARSNKQLRIIITKKDVDLKNRTLFFKLNKPAEMAEIKVYDLDGNVLAEKMKMFDGAKAGTRLSVTWPEIIDDPDNFKIELKATDVNDFWVGFEIVHFYGTIPHEEVVFESGKWNIRPKEAPKLDEVIPKIVAMVNKFKKFSSQMDYGLYVAGYTDTVGSLADNRELSRKRARAIAKYFKDHGLKRIKMSIYVRGFGEEVQAVKTKDNVDEERNRRADYIISNFPPNIAGPGSWAKIQ